MKIIGITGKSGSGKSTLTAVLSKALGCNSIDIDKIGHKATNDEQISKKLCQIFGYGITNKEGKIDRKKLGNIVFSSKEKMDKLTEVTWGYMQEVLDKYLRKQMSEIIILEWALLPSSKYWDSCDIKILMKADDKQRKNKVIQRDNITEEYFLKRDSGSMDYTKMKFDYIFDNDYNMQTMEMITNIVVERI